MAETGLVKVFVTMEVSALVFVDKQEGWTNQDAKKYGEKMAVAAFPQLWEKDKARVQIKIDEVMDIRMEAVK